MIKRLIYAALVTAGVVALAAGSYAVASGESRSGPDHIQTDLEGFQENPSISTTGTGHLDLRIDDETQTIEYELSYSDLEGVLVPDGRVLAAHIHLGARRVNGGVVAFLCGGGGKPPCPTPGGSVSGTIQASDISNVAQGLDPGPTAFEEFVRAIRAGFTYVNVHTTRWPGGEIRGQIHDHDRK